MLPDELILSYFLVLSFSCLGFWSWFWYRSCLVDLGLAVQSLGQLRDVRNGRKEAVLQHLNHRLRTLAGVAREEPRQEKIPRSHVGNALELRELLRLAPRRQLMHRFGAVEIIVAIRLEERSTGEELVKSPNDHTSSDGEASTRAYGSSDGSLGCSVL